MKNKIKEFLAFFYEKHTITDEDIDLFFGKKDFKVGDHVRIIDRLEHEISSSHLLEIGYTGYITKIEDDDDEIPISIDFGKAWVSSDEIELV